MLRATIYKDEKGYILYSQSKTLAGFHIGTPNSRIWNDEAEKRLVDALFITLSAYKEKVETPKFNKKLDESKKQEIRRKCKELGIKSMSSLDKKPVLMCSVEMNDKIISLTSWQHDLSMKGRGYTINDNLIPIQITADDNKQNILKAIEAAFENCE